MTEPETIHFAVWWPVTTRWSDNDMFGHLNNAVYYSLFDTAINGWLADSAGVDPMAATALPLVAESSCRYLAELAYPEALVVGIGIERLGTSSVTYVLGVKNAGAPDAPIAAIGRWVHVYVDQVTRRPVPIPDPIRELLDTALIPRK